MDEQSDRDEQSDEEERAPAHARPDGRAPPTPARNGPPRPPPTRPRANRRHEHAGRGRKRDGQAKPTPARAFGGGSGGPPNGDVDAAEAVLESGGRTWAVRVLGRSGGGRARSGAVPLLLLGFWEDGCDGERPALEAIVVGRTLAELASERLEAALAEARPPREGPHTSTSDRSVAAPTPPPDGRMSRRRSRP
jgi:hypothetical protein